MKVKPYFASVCWLPTTSEARIASRMLNTTNAKVRVTHSKALSAHGAERKRRASLASLIQGWIVRAVFSRAPCTRSVQRLAGSVFDLCLPCRLDQLDDGIRHRHVIKFIGHLGAVLERPLEEPEHFP